MLYSERSILTYSIKAVRVLKHNTRWAAKLAKREERKRVREERIAAKQQAEIKLEAERARKERATNP